MRRFVIGDIHGNYKALMECLDLVKFDYDKDELISLGDIVDRGPDTYLCVEELLKIKNLICVKGNHDMIFEEYIKTGFHGLGYRHGFQNTLNSYSNVLKTDVNLSTFPKTHLDFFNSQKAYHVIDNICFVHGGFNRHYNIKGQSIDILAWDRDLVMSAMSYGSMVSNKYKFKMEDNFDKVFVGHTPTLMWKPDALPIRAANVILLDTGAGYNKGKLTIMNIDTLDFSQSSFGNELYNNIQE